MSELLLLKKLEYKELFHKQKKLIIIDYFRPGFPKVGHKGGRDE